MGAIVNAIVIAVAGSIGLLLKKGIPVNIHERMMEGVGLAVVAIGISGVLKGENTIVMILSMVIGVVIGEWLDIDKFVSDSAIKIERKVSKKSSKNSNSKNDGISWINAFVNATLITCVGSMSIIGSLESGLLNDNTTLYSKSIIDAITSFLLASSLGAGAILSSVSVLVFEGCIILFAKSMASFLPTEVISEVTCVGSIILFALGLNMLKITQFKILNFTPAIILPIILMLFM